MAARSKGKSEPASTRANGRRDRGELHKVVECWFGRGVEHPVFREREEAGHFGGHGPVVDASSGLWHGLIVGAVTQPLEMVHSRPRASRATSLTLNVPYKWSASASLTLRSVGRPAKFDSEQILDAAAELIAEGGPGRATMAGIADRLGAPTGSIYHRFESRDLLLARLWVRAAGRAQEGFVTSLAQQDIEQAAVDAALHIPRWSRANVPDACIMLLHRRQDLAEEWPEDLGSQLSELQRTVEDALRGFVRRRFGSVSKAQLDVASYALLDVPYAAVRRYLLAGIAPPPSVDRLVEMTCRSVLWSD